MLITKLILHKYKRLSLSNINTLTLTPDKKIIMIIAKNGTGKSSTLFELSPIPANLKEYEDDGYKEIHIEHNSNNYILTSGKVSKNKHSFLFNNIELNRAGTRKVQLQLVAEHFNYTPYIHDVMLNIKKFTDMSVGDRKKWFTSISDIDYNYSIKVYENIKKRVRDISGGIKILQNKLSKEESDIITEESLKKLEEDLKYYRLLLDNLLSSKNLNIKNINIDIDKELSILNNRADEIISKLSSEVVYSSIDNTLSILKEKYQNRIHSISEVEKELKSASILDTEIDVDIESKLNIAKAELSRRESKLPRGITVENIQSIYDSFIELYPEVLSFISDLREYETINLTRDEISDLHTKVKVQEEELFTLNKQIEIKSTRYRDNESKKTDKVTCPECNNQFYNGYVESESKLLKQKLEEYSILKEKLEKEYKDSKEKLENYKTKVSILDNIHSMLQHTNSQKIYTEILNFNRDGLSTITDKLYEYKNMLYNNLDILKLEDEVVRLSKLYDISLVQIEVLEKQKDLNKNILEERLHLLLNEKKEIENKITILNNSRSKIEELKEIEKKIKSIFKNRKKIVKNQIEEIRNNKINEMVHYVRGEIANIERVLNSYKYTEMNIQTLRKEITEYKNIESILKLAIKEMSPTEGLIAKSISSFLNIFMQSMNEIISEVWSYDLEVLPCKIDNDGDLDYKFPIVVDNNTDNIVNDICNGSSSMLEIIDLAFRIVSMQYLGLEAYPLYLDEFSKTMDPKHRLSVYDAIDKLSETSFNQIFIISHFESMYARFKSNTNLVVLSEDNMMLDKKMKYNEILKME